MRLYTAVVHAVALKRTVSVIFVEFLKQGKITSSKVYFSIDMQMEATEILEMYQMKKRNCNTRNYFTYRYLYTISNATTNRKMAKAFLKMVVGSFTATMDPKKAPTTIPMAMRPA